MTWSLVADLPSMMVFAVSPSASYFGELLMVSDYIYLRLYLVYITYKLTNGSLSGMHL